jgi:hypothetical protein
MPLLGIFLGGGSASTLGCLEAMTPGVELFLEFAVGHVVSVDDIVGLWIVCAKIEFGIVVEVEFVSGRFIVIWDIVNNVCFHFFEGGNGGWNA